MCHLILLLPLLGLPLFGLMPWGGALSVNLSLWLISAFLYYQIAGAMKRPLVDGYTSLLGTKAEVVSVVTPDYYARYMVRAGGELWSASGSGVFQPGETVNITALDGNRLIVERAEQDPGCVSAEQRHDGVKTGERHCH